MGIVATVVFMAVVCAYPRVSALPFLVESSPLIDPVLDSSIFGIEYSNFGFEFYSCPVTGSVFGLSILFFIN